MPCILRDTGYEIRTTFLLPARLSLILLRLKILVCPYLLKSFRCPIFCRCLSDLLAIGARLMHPLVLFRKLINVTESTFGLTSREGGFIKFHLIDIRHDKAVSQKYEAKNEPQN